MSKPKTTKIENRGRKPLPPEERRSEWIGAAFTEEEKQQVTELRTKKRPDLNQSEYVRHRLLGTEP